MITSRSKCRPRNNSSMLLNLLTPGPQLSERPMYPTELPYLHQGPIIRLVTIWKASLLVCKSNHLNRVYLK